MALRPKKRLTQESGHRLVTAPAVEPVTLAQVRTLLREPPTEDNDFLEECIIQAREVFEAATGIACITQTWRLTLDDWPGASREPWWNGVEQLPRSELYRSGVDYIAMPRYPLQTLDSVTTYDLDNSGTVIDESAVFFVDDSTYPGRVVLNAGATWPTALRDRAAIELVYSAGFGDEAADVPFTVRRAIQQVAGYLYENRGTGCSAQFALSQTGALQIASEYMVVRL